MMPFFALIILLAAPFAAVAAETGYDHWHLEAKGDTGQGGVVTTREGRVVRLLLAVRKERKSQATLYAAYNDGEAVRRLRAKAEAQQTAGIAVARGLSGTGKAVCLGDGSPVVEVAFAIVLGGDGQLSGTVTVAGNTLTCDGHLVREDAAAKRLAMPAEASWPQVGGAQGDYSATSALKPPPMATPDKFRLAWISQDVMTSSAAGMRLHTAPNGGSAGPVLHHGRVFQYYYVPNGGIVDGELLKSRDSLPEPWNRTLADDVMSATDAATGRTLWRTVVPLAGLTYMVHKPEMQGHTMVASGDRVFAVGSAGMVYALEAATGRIIWRTPSPLDEKTVAVVAEMAASGQRSAAFRRFGNRNRGHSPALAAGVLVVPSLDGAGLCGLDAADGTVLWQRGSMLADNASPLTWRSGGAERIIAVGRGTGEKEAVRHVAACLDPRTGKDLWVSEPLGGMPYGATINGDLLFVNVGSAMEGREARLGCLRLTADGPQRLWQAPDQARGGVFAKYAGSNAMLLGDAVHVRVWPERIGVAVLDAATGAVRAGPTGAWDVSNEGTGVGQAGLLVWFEEWQHGHTRPDLFDDAAKHLGRWHPLLLPSSTPYQNPGAGSPILADGRFIVRGMDGLYCFDLRQD